MASIEDFPDFCGVCQEPFDPALPRENLRVIRAKECPRHFVHEKCVLQWFRRRHKCAVCARPCTEFVDVHGENVEKRASPTVIIHHIEFYVLTRFQSPEMQLIHMERVFVHGLLDLMGFPDRFQPRELLPREIALMRSMYERYAVQGLMQPNCQVCSRPCSAERQAITVPCGHKFHNTCLFPRLFPRRGICPAEQCGAQVAVAGNPITDETFFIHWLALDNLLLRIARQPNNLQPPIVSATRAIISRRANGQTVQCSCCKKDLPLSESVRPNTCQHRYHRKCLHESTKSNKQCPRRHCKKKFMRIEE